MHSKTLKGLLAAGVSLFSFNVAVAQEAPKSASPPRAATVDELVVTAQRRSERYVDVPTSVSVVTAAQLATSGVSSSRDLRLLTPGLNITLQGTFIQPTIRGVGTSVTGTGADPNVAVYVDGVYQASQGSTLFDFNNIEQIETLKGPQGSLYGRNATGGAIVVTTKAPSLTEMSGNAEASYGRFHEVRASGYVNIPVSDQLAVSVAAYGRKNDGYVKNVFLNEDAAITKTSGVRARVLFQPSDSLRFILTGAHTNQSDTTAYSYSPLNGNTPQAGSLGQALGRAHETRKIALDTRPYNKLEMNSANLNGQWTGAWGTLTSISSYTDVEFPFWTDLDGTERRVQSFRAIPQTQRTETQEFIYASPDTGRFSWIGGLYYYHDRSHTQAQVFVGGNPLPFPPLRPDVHVTATAYAAYAEGTFDLTDRLHLTAGGRYSSEKKHAENNDGPGGVLMLDATKTFNAFTPHVALRYDVTSQSSAYASYSQGFKSGLFDGAATGTCTTIANPTCPFKGVPVKPEKVRAYEAGYKYNAGGTVFSTAVYYSQYKNIQINALNAQNLQVLYNAAAGEIYGADAELTIDLTENLNLHVGGAYTHAEYTKFPLGQNFVPLPAGGNAQVTGDDAGNHLIRSPEFTAFASGTYTQPLPVGSLRSTLTVSYSDSFFWQVDNRLKQPSFTIVNAQVSWISPSERWKVTVFGDNLTDERTEIYVREATVGDFASYSKPRSYGIGLAVNF
ncbi:MAG: putative TonB-dependent receptor [Phenylobacterium sp.]|nr:putative TonB-dependent receptor [Phenylobacterium sp.]